MKIEIIVHRSVEYKAWRITSLAECEWPAWLLDARERGVVIRCKDGYITKNSQVLRVGDYVVNDEIPAIFDQGEFARNFRTIRVEVGS